MRFSVFVVLILGLLGAGAVLNLHSFNHFKVIERSFDGQCEPVRGIPGSEDIQIAGGRRAFISSRDRRGGAERGAIHIFDLDEPLAADSWRDRTNGQPAVFKPLGIDYFEDSDVRRLFVVNEANAAIEMFDVQDNGDLVHLETFAERRLNSPNNVVAVGRRSFYVTNDVRPGRNTLLASLHFLSRTGSGEVLFTDGTVWRVVADGLRYANGIELSADQKRLYVAETAAAALMVFDRDTVTGSLTAIDTIELDSAPDNISIDAEGALWVAALPKPLAVSRFAKNADVKAPSQIWRIREGERLVIIYRDNGEELSASTAAAHIGGTLLIGAVHEDKFLYCQLPGQSDEASTTP